VVGHLTAEVQHDGPGATTARVRHAFDRFVAEADATILVVTAVGPDGDRSGCLVGFATQCSIEPPRLLVCVSEENHTYRTIESGASLLVVHLVPQPRASLAVLFGGTTGDEVDKFARCAWRAGPEGVPVLDGCPWVAGRIVARHRLGDHVGYVLDPVEADVDTAVAPAGTGAPVRLREVSGLHPGHEA
jgi:flavin reductase (DIM6/NTAB) family NADH-FMN oxidoreductase RutF